MTRYQVIADYPDSPYEIGQILTGAVIDKYPAIFKRLEWWEELPVKELPMYLKLAHSGHIEKVVRYKRDSLAATPLWATNDRGHSMSVPHYLPSTEQEYNDYKKQNP